MSKNVGNRLPITMEVCLSDISRSTVNVNVTQGQISKNVRNASAINLGVCIRDISRSRSWSKVEVNFKPDAVAGSYVGRVGGQKKVGGWKSVKLPLIQ